MILFFQAYAHPPYLHSFPTRRSSDLEPRCVAEGLVLVWRLHIDVLAVDQAVGSQPVSIGIRQREAVERPDEPGKDRKSTRLNSSHRCISYAVFCLKKKKQNKEEQQIR